MFEHYAADGNGCLREAFWPDLACGRRDAMTFGTGVGTEWQKLTKACPAFATEYPAVVVRSSKGSGGEFGPLRGKAAEVRPECDAMLANVQRLVEVEPAFCAVLGGP